jgi:hypothetical protein
MARDHIEYLICNQLNRSPLIDRGIATGFRVAELSKDNVTGAISYYASVGAHWIRMETGYYESDLEILVLKGSMSIGGITIREGHYSFLPAGCLLGTTYTDEACEFLMLFGGPTEFIISDKGKDGAQTQLRIDDMDAQSMPWGLPPAHEGRPAEDAPPGLGVKFLRVDPITGAYTLLTRQPEGWFDPKLEKHSIWEELVLLDGDYLMGRMGKVDAGTYIFRDGCIAHGPQVSRYGCVWFARGNGPIDFDYEEVPWANALVEKYLTSDKIFSEDRSIAPWGNWL